MSETKMRKANRLSKRLDWKVGVEKDNEKQIFFKDYWIYSLSEVIIEEPEVDILEKIKITRSKNEEIVRIIEEMKKAEVRNIREEE